MMIPPLETSVIDPPSTFQQIMFSFSLLLWILTLVSELALHFSVLLMKSDILTSRAVIVHFHVLISRTIPGI